MYRYTCFFIKSNLPTTTVDDAVALKSWPSRHSQSSRRRGECKVVGKGKCGSRCVLIEIRGLRGRCSVVSGRLCCKADSQAGLNESTCVCLHALLTAPVTHTCVSKRALGSQATSVLLASRIDYRQSKQIRIRTQISESELRHKLKLKKSACRVRI